MQAIPLAERMRPENLNDYVGQEHIIGEDSVLSRAIKSGVVPSMILWGPPGVGKTTLARLMAKELKRPFYTLSAINSGVKDVRDVIDKVKNKGLFGAQGAILFIDEIHRFSKTQQDSLLGSVEQGVITLIGATTENPSFEVIPALLSRCQVFVLKHLEKSKLEGLLHKALKEDKFLAQKKITLKDTGALIAVSGGDARKLLNALELVVQANDTNELIITDDLVEKNIHQNLSLYDKTGEQHYDIISAFIKSIRGSDPNAAVYWLARMVEGGEDPSFIARRMLILASEDIGNANPTAMILANNTFQAVNVIGWPEARIILSQCAIYLACSPKSNAAYMAINDAQQMVQKYPNLSVPLHLRNAPTQLMKELDYGKEYKYSHGYEGNFYEQEYLPEEIKNSKFFRPGKNAREEELRQFLKNRWKDKYNY